MRSHRLVPWMRVCVFTLALTGCGKDTQEQKASQTGAKSAPAAAESNPTATKTPTELFTAGKPGLPEVGPCWCARGEVIWATLPGSLG